MQGHSFHSRAVAFAVSVGCVAFILSLFASQAGDLDGRTTQFALVIAIICGVLSWASALRSISSVAQSIDHVSERLLQAANGDLESGFPADVKENLPDLADALDNLIHQVRDNIESVEKLAMFDPVTGLTNRASFYRAVEKELATMPVDGTAAMFFVDLNGFKQVNDTRGHAVGDQLLACVAERLRAVVMDHAANGGQKPVLGRLAGDEFTIFCPGLAPGDATHTLGHAVRSVLSEQFDVGGGRIRISASVGASHYPGHGRTLTELLRAADHAMYEAKHNDDQRVVVYSRMIEQRLATEAELQRDLRIAIERSEFLLEFQPQVDISTGRIVAAEALLRWAHPNRAMILPDAFLSFAQETGLIVELGQWVLEQAGITVSRWRMAGIDHRMAINVSARELGQGDFFDGFDAMLARHNVMPAHFEIEIAEGLAMALDSRALAGLTRLREQGLRIVLDDFGTGMSNLSRLCELPIDRVKIDRALVRDITVSPSARTICSAIIALINGLGREVVVEGVENATELEMLRIAGCSIFQGFHVGKPARDGIYVERFAPTARQPDQILGR